MAYLGDKRLVQIWGSHPKPYQVTMSKSQCARLVAAMKYGATIQVQLDNKTMWINCSRIEIIQHAPVEE